jgi:hypothetical protein
MFKPQQKLPPLVLAGFDPRAFSPRKSSVGIHGPRQAPRQLPWMPGTRPGVNDQGLFRVHYEIASEG